MVVLMKGWNRLHIQILAHHLQIGMGVQPHLLRKLKQEKLSKNMVFLTGWKNINKNNGAGEKSHFSTGARRYGSLEVNPPMYQRGVDTLLTPRPTLIRI